MLLDEAPNARCRNVFEINAASGKPPRAATNALGVLFINQLPPSCRGIVALRGFQFFRGVFSTRSLCRAVVFLYSLRWNAGFAFTADSWRGRSKKRWRNYDKSEILMGLGSREYFRATFQINEHHKVGNMLKVSTSSSNGARYPRTYEKQCILSVSTLPKTRDRRRLWRGCAKPRPRFF